MKNVEFLYSEDDCDIVDKLERHCITLVKRLKLFTIIKDNVGEISDNDNLPNLVLVFLSSNFISDDKLMDKLDYYYELRQKGKLSLMPIYVSAIDKDCNPLYEITGYPSNKQGLLTFNTREIDSMLVEAVGKIKNIINR